MLVFTLDPEMLLTLSWKVLISFFFQKTSNEVSTISAVDFLMSMVELISWFSRRGDTQVVSRAQRIKIICSYEAKVAAAGVFCKVLVNPTAIAGDAGDVGWIPWRRQWQPSPVFLPVKSHEQRKAPVHGWLQFMGSQRHDWPEHTHTQWVIYPRKYDFSIPHSNCFSSIWETILS